MVKGLRNVINQKSPLNIDDIDSVSSFDENRETSNGDRDRKVKSVLFLNNPTQSYKDRLKLPDITTNTSS